LVTPLCPEEVFAVLALHRTPVGERGLNCRPVLLREIECLKLRVVRCRWKLLELQLVNVAGSDREGQEPDQE
jgi:hypothetical protein